MSDVRWQSNGGMLIDGTGDWAFASETESLRDMVRTRVKGALNAWKLYAIGADLQRCMGDANLPELETKIQRYVSSALSRDFLPPGSFEVQTLSAGESTQIFIYVFQQLVAKATLNSDGTVQVS